MMDESSDSLVGMNSLETLWGQQLSSKSKTFEWDGEDDEKEGIESTLELKLACLGPSAKPNERNLVAVTFEDDNSEDKQIVIASLKLDNTEQVNLGLMMQAPIKIELIEGSGPIHLSGNMKSVLIEENDSDEEEDEDESEEEVEKPKFLNKDDTKNNASKKRPAAGSPAKKASKVAKTESDDENEEEDTSMELEKQSKKPAPANQKSKPVLPSNEDDDNEEDEDEMDSDEDNSDLEYNDEEEEEDGDSEEEEEESPPPKKNNKPNKSNKKFSSRTPQPTKPLKPIIKTPKSVQPKGKGNKAGTPKGTPSIDELKKKLLQVPAIPKKIDKFNNFLKNNYKITDNETKKQMWEFVQKNKK